MAQRDRMRLYAPSDGRVEDIQVEVGMAVDKNTPALRFVNINPVLLELYLPVEEAMALKVGDKADVRLHPGAQEPVIGEINHISSVAILSNRTLRVRLSVPNVEEKPVGLTVDVSFPPRSNP